PPWSYVWDVLSQVVGPALLVSLAVMLAGRLVEWLLTMVAGRSLAGQPPAPGTAAPAGAAWGVGRHLLHPPVAPAARPGPAAAWRPRPRRRAGVVPGVKAAGEGRGGRAGRE